MPAIVKFIYSSTVDGVIGDKGGLPWNLPQDLRVFKEKTLHSTILMGRKTYESIPEQNRPLPNRHSVVVTRSKPSAIFSSKSKSVTVINDPVEYVMKAKGEVWVIGGKEIFEKLLPYCIEIHHTEIHLKVKGDTIFNFDKTGWEMTEDSGILINPKGVTYRMRVWSVPLLLQRYV